MGVSTYKPELGQLAFGQPWQQNDLTVEFECALDALRNCFCAMRRPNPFANESASFHGNNFEAHSYSWTDDEQPFNFAWRDIRVSWYKYFGRGTSCNRSPDAKELQELMKECFADLFAQQS